MRAGFDFVAAEPDNYDPDRLAVTIPHEVGASSATTIRFSRVTASQTVAALAGWLAEEAGQ